jgi:hypothetical protein
MVAAMSGAELPKCFPVPFENINDPLASLEPGKAALVQLSGGEYVVLDWGQETKRLTVRIDEKADPGVCLRQLFHEVPSLRSRLLWHRPDVRLPRISAPSRSQSSPSAMPVTTGAKLSEMVGVPNHRRTIAERVSIRESKPSSRSVSQRPAPIATSSRRSASRNSISEAASGKTPAVRRSPSRKK